MGKHVYCVSMLTLANKHKALSFQCIVVFFRKNKKKYLSLLIIIALQFFTRGNIFKWFKENLETAQVLKCFCHYVHWV